MSLYYIMFPVGPSKNLSDIFPTVGLLHKFLVKAFYSGTIVHAVFFTGFIISLNVVISSVQYLRMMLQDENGNLHAVLLGTVPVFIFMQGFSHGVWEKYFITVLPFLLISICSVIRENPLNNRNIFKNTYVTNVSREE